MGEHKHFKYFNFVLQELSYDFIYYSCEYPHFTDSDLIAQVIMKWFFEEEALINKVTSIISPQKINIGEENSNRLRAALGYDVIFTIINSDPENINFNWDVKNDVNGN